MLDERQRAAREDEIVVNIEERSRTAARLRRNHLEALVRMIQARDQIVTDHLNLNAERLESFDHTLDVTGSAARLCAWTRCRTKVNDSPRLTNRDRRSSRSQNFLLES